MIELERDAPDLEDLAAYLDGRLPAERKALVEERLLRDEDYYDVYRETIEFQQEQAQADETDGGGDVVAPAVWWRTWKAASLAVAAVAATLLVVIDVPHLMLGTPPGGSLARQAFSWGVRLILAPSANDWVDRLDARAVIDSGTQWDAPGWQVMRGSSDPGRPEEVAFRIGTRTVDLRIALAAEDRESATILAGYLKLLTGEDDVLVFMQGDYADLQKRIANEEFGALKTEAAQLEKNLADWFEEIETEGYVLGAWNEAGRLAALAKDAEALAGIFKQRRAAQGIKEIEPYLETLKTILEQPEPNFETAENAFKSIARTLAGRG